MAWGVFMAVYKNNSIRKKTKTFNEAKITQYSQIANLALHNSIEYLNLSYSQKLCGAEGSIEFKVFTPMTIRENDI